MTDTSLKNGGYDPDVGHYRTIYQKMNGVFGRFPRKFLVAIPLVLGLQATTNGLDLTTASSCSIEEEYSMRSDLRGARH